MTPGGAWGAAWREMVYATVDGVDLVVRRYRPVCSAEHDRARWPVVIHFVEGGWVASDPVGAAALHKALARAGAVVIVPTLRSAPDHRHPAASVDAERMLRWVVARADELAVDLEQTVLLGTGAGAHALLGSLVDSRSIQKLLNPVALVTQQPDVDPLTTRRRHGSVDGADREYFGSLQRMRLAGLPERLMEAMVLRLPLLVLAGQPEQTRVPPEVTDELAFAWRRAGGRVRVAERVATDSGLIDLISALLGGATRGASLVTIQEISA